MADQDHCDAAVLPSLEDPLAPAVEAGTTAAGDGPKTAYQAAMDEGERLLRRPREAAGVVAISRQHQKGRMTVWERIAVLTRSPPDVLFGNWGPNLDGASLVISTPDGSTSLTYEAAS